MKRRGEASDWWTLAGQARRGAEESRHEARALVLQAQEELTHTHTYLLTCKSDWESTIYLYIYIAATT